MVPALVPIFGARVLFHPRGIHALGGACGTIYDAAIRSMLLSRYRIQSFRHSLSSRDGEYS